MKNQKKIEILKKNQKGITLIALVVTIVVLLILAGISIGMLTGENSLIGRTKEAKIETEIAGEREIVQLSTTDAKTRDKYGDISKSNLENALDTNVGEGKTEVLGDEDAFIVEFKETDRYYKVEDGEVEYIGGEEDRNNIGIITATPKTASGENIEVQLTVKTFVEETTVTLKYEIVKAGGEVVSSQETNGKEATVTLNKDTLGEGKYYIKVEATIGEKTKEKTVGSYNIVGNSSLVELTINPAGGTYGGATTERQKAGSTITLSSPTPPNGYTITFDGNGGTASEITKTANKVFSGWTLTGGGSLAGNVYTFGEENGTVVASYTMSSITLPTATRDKYDFVGWYDAKTGGNKIGNAESSYTPTESKTIYAHWNKKIVDISTLTATLSQTTYPYDGTAKTPTVTIKDGDKTLTKDTDYTVIYTNNTNAGTATVTITGKGDYTGTKTVTFTISKIENTIKVTAKIGLTYTGSAQALVTVASAQGDVYYSTSTELTSSNYTTAGSKTIPTGTNAKSYTVYYYTPGNTNYNAKGGNVSVTIASKNMSGLTPTLSQTTYPYDGTAKEPTVTIKDGDKTLTKDTDYTVTYTNNTDIGTATVTITGKGNYTGTKTVTFTIEDKTVPTVTIGTNGGNYVMPSTGNATIKTTITAQDNESGLKDLKYAWSQSNTTEPTDWQTFTNEQEVSKTDISEAGTWYLWINVTDNAGNRAETKTSNAFKVGSNTVAENKISLTADKGYWTNTDVIVTATFGSNLTKNKTLTCTGTSGTDYTKNETTSITVKTEGTKTITASAQDTAGNTVTVTYNVTNIDKTEPTINTDLSGELDASGTLPLSVKVTDSRSGISKITWYYKLSTSSNYTDVTNTYATMNGTTAGSTSAETKTRTLTGLELGEYSAYAIIYDVAGNSKQTSVVTITIPAGAPDAEGYNTETATKDGGEATATNPTIPAGFKPVDVTGNYASSWEDGTGGKKPSEQSVKNGLVIEDKAGNQFVWVPVENAIYDSTKDSSLPKSSSAGQLQGKTYTPMAIETSTGKYNSIVYEFSTSAGAYLMYPSGTKYQGSSTKYREPDTLSDFDTNYDADYLSIIKGILTDQTAKYASRSTFKTTMEEDYKAMVESVKKYKGFYVGRYEMSSNSTTKVGSTANTTALNAETSSANMWYGLYAKAKTYTNSSNGVTSSMIWGSQYDQMMIWMRNSGIDVASSTVPNSGTRNTSTTTTGVTGSTDVINNVYDLYGGRYEFTLEAFCTYGRVVRGNDTSYSVSPKSRIDDFPYRTFSTLGSRLTLYINLPAYEYTDADGNTVKTEEPKLSGNMELVTYNGGSTTGSKWANAKTSDGSLWVWIPRYAYMITSGYHSNTAGTVKIAFIDKNNKFLNDADKTLCSTITEDTTESGAGQTKWLVHPAFTSNANNGGGFGGTNENGATGIEGFWFAKFETSGSNTVGTGYKSLPGVSALRSTSIGDFYKYARQQLYGETGSKDSTDNYTSFANSHMVKNSEWGAVAYLSQSAYGRNRTRVIENSTGYITGGTSTLATIYGANANQSTTGNAYGVYDMSGGSCEHVASYVNNGNSNLTASSYGAGMNTSANVGTSTKYKTVYAKGSSDGQSANYEANVLMKGDAIYETSSSSSITGSWYSAYAEFPYSSSPFFGRGGGYYSDGPGVFFLYPCKGNSASDSSCRLALVP